MLEMDPPAAGDDVRTTLRNVAGFYMQFGIDDPVRYQLLSQRTIPGFEPSPESYALAQEAYAWIAAPFRAVVDVTQEDLDLISAVVAWDEPGAGRSCDLPEELTLGGFADGLAALIESLRLGPAHVGGLSLGGTVVLELYRRHPGLVATLIMIDTYAGWKGSLPADEVRARVVGARRMLAAPPGEFDPTLPGLFAGDPPADSMRLFATIGDDVRPATLGQELASMAETDLSDLLPHAAVPTLLLWGDSDARSLLRDRGGQAT